MDTYSRVSFESVDGTELACAHREPKNTKGGRPSKLGRWLLWGFPVNILSKMFSPATITACVTLCTAIIQLARELHFKKNQVHSNFGSSELFVPTSRREALTGRFSWPRASRRQQIGCG